MDFGIAHAADVTGFTQTGAFVGTAAYAAPEQLLGASPTPETDIYALGVVLFELLTGQRPHAGASVPALARAKNVDAPRSLAVLAPGIPAALAALTTQLLAREPKDRPTLRDIEARLEDARLDCSHVSLACDAPRVADTPTPATITPTAPLRPPSRSS